MRREPLLGRLLEEGCHWVSWNVTLLFLSWVNTRWLSSWKLKVLSTLRNGYFFLIDHGAFLSSRSNWALWPQRRNGLLWVSPRIGRIEGRFVRSFAFSRALIHKISQLSFKIILSLLHLLNLIFLCFLSHEGVVLVMLHLLLDFIVTQIILLLHLLHLLVLKGSCSTTL